MGLEAGSLEEMGLCAVVEAEDKEEAGVCFTSDCM